MVNGALRGGGGGGGIQLLFSKGFLLVLAKYSFGRGYCALGYYSMKFRNFSDIS